MKSLARLGLRFAESISLRRIIEHNFVIIITCITYIGEGPHRQHGWLSMVAAGSSSR